MRGRALIAVLLLAVAASAQEPVREPARFLDLDWSYDLLGEVESGPALLVWFGPDLWRLEAGRGHGDDPARRAGEGWTLAAPGDSTLYLQPWRDDLEPLEPPEARRLRALVRLLLDAALDDLDGLRRETPAAPPGPTARLPWRRTAERSAEPGAFRLRWDDGAAAGLLGRLERRGLGRGDAGETWTGQALDAALSVGSSRRPGRLNVRVREAASVRADPFEATLPLWPLAEVVLEPAGK